MRLLLLCVGRARAGPERDLAARYLERAGLAGRPLGFTKIEAREFDESRARDAAARKAAEAKTLLSAASGPILALDEKGETPSSRDFAALLGALRDSGAGTATLMIGGPDGLADEARSAAARLLSFGRMTFPHQLARIMAAEQIYRAMSILAGHPYHRD